MSNSQEIASNIFKQGFRVRYNFDGAMTTSEGASTEKRRAVGYDGDKSTFTWKRFLSLEDSYNPSPGQLNPWSLKAWYKWGCRNFHFHNPFGKVAQGNSQELVYEVDQFLNAKNGLTINGVVQNTPMPWLTNDFTDTIKALTTGQKGNLDQQTWDSWTIGSDAWFNPNEPIDLIVYIGGMANPGNDIAYQSYVNRWNSLFATNATSAAKRLRDSVNPIILANCKLAFDAAVASPGSIPGELIPLTVQNTNLQKGWWNFFKWAERTIGKNRIYVESHPFKHNGISNSYLGYNIIADDDWSYTPNVASGPNGPHFTSEMGKIEFWRAIWQNAENATPLISRIVDGQTVKERYWFLDESDYTNNVGSEKRLTPATCCEKGHNYYYNSIYPEIIVYHLLEKQNIRDEINIKENNTISGILVPHNLLQVLPESYTNDVNWKKQFANRFISSSNFIDYISDKLSNMKDLEKTLYRP
jgi:hypothetical protein